MRKSKLKNKLTKCFVCFCGNPCGGNKKLSRKKKKELKDFFKYVKPFCESYLFEGLSSCNLGDQYQMYCKSLPLIPFFKKNQKAISLILNVAHEPIVVIKDNKFSFHFVWEVDDDFGGQGGTMPFLYNKKDFNDTWAGEESENLFENLGIPFGSITNSKDLVKFVYKNYNNLIGNKDLNLIDEEIYSELPF